jgi:hypothetical protein
VAAAVSTVTAALLAQSGCINSRCIRNSDCPAGQICVGATGQCQPPECLSDTACGPGRICESFFCVAGCRSDDDCAPDERCDDYDRCRQIGTECDCLLGPAFCLEDLNPRSAGFGRQACVADDDEAGTAVFFGSVGCSHCRAIYDALLRRRAQLQGEGLAPRLLWVQLKDRPITPDEITTLLTEAADTPIVLDTAELDIWGRYGADWYHLVVVDGHKCIARHWGPVYSTDVDGAVGEEIVEVWRRAMTEECPEPVEPVEPVDGGDADGEDGREFGFELVEGYDVADPAPESLPETPEAPDAVDVAPEAADAGDSPDAG